MADRPKPKKATGERNTDRKSGKAPKKHPKTPASKGKSWEEREAERKVRRAPLMAEYAAKIEAQKQAEEQRRLREQAAAEDKRKRKSRQSEAQRRRAEAQQAAAKVTHATIDTLGAEQRSA